MTLRRFAAVLTPAIRTYAALSVLGAFAIGLSAANTEDVVAGHFTAALEQGSPATTVATETSAGLPISGSEAYWLAAKQRPDTGGAALEPATWAPLISGLSVGDRFTMSNGKADRLLEVIAIAEVEQTASSPQTGRQVAITCRDLSSPNHAATTFLVPAGSVLGLPKSARAL